MGVLPGIGGFIMDGPSLTGFVQTATPTMFGAVSSVTATKDIGVAQTDRIVVVLVSFEATAVVNSVTIGGSAASRIQTTNTTANPDLHACIAYLAVPSGTSAEIIITGSASMVGGAYEVFAIYGCAGLVDSALSANSATTASGNMDLFAGGVGIGVGHLNTNGGNTWSGLTEITDQIIGTASAYTSAALNVSSTSLNAAVSVGGGPSYRVAAFASFD